VPHQCTACGHTFEDGSKEMLSGCPSCGGTTFQFRPSGAADDEPPADAPEPPERDDGGVAERVGRTATAMRDWVSSDDPPGSGGDAPADGERPARPDAPAETGGDARRRADADGSNSHGEASNHRANAAVETAGDEDVGTDTALNTDTAPNTEPSTTADADADTTADTDAGADPEPSSTDWPDPPDVSHVRDGRPGRPDAEPVDEDGTGEEATTDEEASERDDDAEAPTDEDGLIVADERPVETTEDTAQASARSEMARPDELPPREEPAAPSSGRVVSEPSGEKPDMAELRAELNDQFESIKIVEPGQYELNLMELYDREEYIISLKENGRYVIQMPEDWLGDRADE
jgi:hypothetical protein